MRKWINLFEQASPAPVTNLNEVTRPKDRLLAHEILMRAGYSVIGAGSFASVYEKPGTSYVLKLFDDDDEAYRAFIDLVRSHPNAHFPKLIGKPVKVSEGVHAIRMERLTRYRADPTLFGVYLLKRDAELSPDSYTSDQMSDVSEIFYEYPDLQIALDLIKDHLLPKYRIDMNADNLMMRGSTIVFTDPVANLETANQDRITINVPEPVAPATSPVRRKNDAALQAILDDELLNDLLGETQQPGDPLYEKVIRLEDAEGHMFVVTKNPSRQQFLRDTASPDCDMKGLIDGRDIYYWPAWHAHHGQIDHRMGLGGAARIFIHHNGIMAGSQFEDLVTNHPVLQMLYRGDIPFTPE